MDWFLYDRDPRHERVNCSEKKPEVNSRLKITESLTEEATRRVL